MTNRTFNTGIDLAKAFRKAVRLPESAGITNIKVNPAFDTVVTLDVSIILTPELLNEIALEYEK